MQYESPKTMTTVKHVFWQDEDENVILEKAAAHKSCWKFDVTSFEGPLWLDFSRFSRKIVDRKTHYYPLVCRFNYCCATGYYIGTDVPVFKRFFVKRYIHRIQFTSGNLNLNRGNLKVEESSMITFRIKLPISTRLLEFRHV